MFFTFEPYLSVVPLDDRFDDRHAQSGRVLATQSGAPGLAEFFKQRLAVLGRNADASICNYNYNMFFSSFRSNVIVPPSGVNLSALEIRFWMTCENLSPSSAAYTGCSGAWQSTLMVIAGCIP